MQLKHRVLLALAAACSGPAIAQTGVPVSRTTTYQYDAYGTLYEQVVEPNDPQYRLTTTFELDPVYGVVKKQTTTWTDPSDPTTQTLTGATQTRVERRDYDAKFRFVETLTNAKSQIERFTFDDKTGNGLTHIDENFQQTSWAYDGWGRRTRETRADGTATSWAYRSCVDTCLNGAVSVKIEQNWAGASQTTVPKEEFSDRLSRQVLQRTWGFDGAAILDQTVYDSLGRTERVSQPYFVGGMIAWTWYDRDPIGRVSQVRAPNKTGSGYDSSIYTYDGLTVTARNAKNQLRTELHNAIGKVKSVVDAVGGAVSYEYDGFGNLLTVKDPLANTITVHYDRLGRKIGLLDPDLGHWTYVVDPAGQTRKHRDAKLQVTEFVFDVLGRMTRRLEPDMDSRWDFDTAANGVGKLAEAYTWTINGKDYRRLHAYDTLGRPTSTVYSLDWDYSETQAYDAFGRADTVHYRRAAKGAGATGVVNSVISRYNAYGHLDRIDRSEGGAALTVWQAQFVDAEGRVKQEQLGNGATSERVYNAYTGRIERIRTGPTLVNPAYQNDTYDYDAVGNLELRTQLNGATTFTESFTYDDLNRLKTSTIGAAVKTFTYDLSGNITSKTGVGTYIYDAQGAGSVRPHAVRRISGVVAGLTNPQFEYDNNGNLMTGLSRSHAWTAANMPLRIEKLSGATAVQGTAFLYSPEHERVQQTVYPITNGATGNPTTTIRYAGAIEKEVDVAANVTIIRIDLPSGVGFIEERIAGTVVAPTASATRNVRYLLKDRLGSTAAVMDQAQATLQRMSYDAWGRRRNTDGTDDTGPLWGTLKNNQDHSGYTGHEHLDQLGLVHMNARMYDPLLGRHSSADPTVPDPKNGQSLNRYTYVYNNGLAFVDPTGLSGDELPPARPLKKEVQIPIGWQTVGCGSGSAQLICRAHFTLTISFEVPFSSSASPVTTTTQKGGYSGDGVLGVAQDDLRKWNASGNLDPAAGWPTPNDILEGRAQQTFEAMSAAGKIDPRFAAAMSVGLWSGSRTSDPIGGPAANGASALPVIRSGTKEWTAAVNALSATTKGKINIRTETASEAKALLQEARGAMDRRKQYTTDLYRKGYEVHNQQNARELGAGNDLQHLKWRDGKAGGHVYYNTPN